MENKANYAVKVAQTIFEQLKATTEPSVILSWGLHGIGAGYVDNGSGFKCPCLLFKVSGLLHDGYVAIAYNEGSDLYDVCLFDHSGNRVGDWHHGIYFDVMGNLIDSIVERSPEWTDEQYCQLSSQDSLKKMLET